MVYRKRNMQHPLIMEDSTAIRPKSGLWKKFALLGVAACILFVVLIVRGY